MKMQMCPLRPRTALVVAVAALASLPALADTVTISTSPQSPILEPGEEILFGTQSPNVSLGSLFNILVEDQAVTSTTSTPTFNLTIADAADNISATFKGTFVGPIGGGVGGTIDFSGTVKDINGVDFVTVTQGVYTIGIAPSFILNAEQATDNGGVGKSDFMSGIMTSSVPEPATFTLAGLALLLLACAGRRRVASGK